MQHQYHSHGQLSKGCVLIAAKRLASHIHLGPKAGFVWHLQEHTKKVCLFVCMCSAGKAAAAEDLRKTLKANEDAISKLKGQVRDSEGGLCRHLWEIAVALSGMMLSMTWVDSADMAWVWHCSGAQPAMTLVLAMAP